VRRLKTSGIGLFTQHDAKPYISRSSTIRRELFKTIGGKFFLQRKLTFVLAITSYS